MNEQTYRDVVHKCKPDTSCTAKNKGLNCTYTTDHGKIRLHNDDDGTSIVFEMHCNNRNVKR